MTGRRSSSPQPRAGSSPTGRPSARLELAGLALLMLATLIVYWPVKGFEFVNYDDNAFIYENARMLEGLTLRNVGWAFTTTVAANWHPLTVLTHLLDCSLFGLNAGGHHLTNVLIHLADVLLLFLLVRRLSLSAGASLLVTALFALHPLNVESVAWVAERKNVLSMLFLFLTLLAYLRYARTGSCRSHAGALLLFAAGLMSKSMLVSVPVLLLLLDFWPLRRGSLASARGALRDAVRLLPEKIPFVLLALGASLLAILTQRESDAVASLASFSIADRVMNAALSYVSYVGQLLWPTHLSVFYPRVFPGAWQSAGAAILLVAASAVAWRQRIRRPYLAFGWLWFLVTLLPVIGLVQVGSQAHADRYGYMPLIGLFVILASLGEEGVRRLKAPRWAAPATGCAVALGLAVATRSQVLVWHDTQTLFEHAIANVKGAYVAHNGLGILYGKSRRYDEARKAFDAALAIDPDYYDAWSNLGQIALDQGDLEGAVRYYQKAIQYRRTAPKTVNNLGTALARLGRYAEAIGYFEESIRLDPDYLSARYNHANVLNELGRSDEAVAEYRRLIEASPKYARAHGGLASIYSKQGKLREALASFETALRLEPDNAQARSGAEEVRQRLVASGRKPPVNPGP
jgi:Tfp pilus assembly protein PilF